MEKTTIDSYKIDMINQMKKIGQESSIGEGEGYYESLDEIRQASRKIGKEVILDNDWLSNINLKNISQGPVDVIDMFSGCGGMSFGFKAISQIIPSFNIVSAFDIDEEANTTYEKNFGIKPKKLDIKELVENQELLNDFKSKYSPKNGKPLVLIGCAPCQGFSSHNKRRKEKDARNSLVGNFAEVAVHLNPDLIVMENVPELLSKKHWEHFSAFKEVLENENYFVRAQIVKIAEYGVPQDRYRALVIASKARFLMPNGVLSNEEFRTVRDTIGNLPTISPGQPHPSDPMHKTSNHKASTIDVISQVPKDGGNRPKHVGPKWYQDVYGRLSWEKPAVTITTCARNPASGRYSHPDQNRGLSIREAALLQSFPNNFQFEGKFGSVFTQIGNAVPPLFSTYLAIHLLGELLGEDVNEELFYQDSLQDIQTPITNSFSSIISSAKTRRDLNSLWLM